MESGLNLKERRPGQDRVDSGNESFSLIGFFVFSVEGSETS